MHSIICKWIRFTFWRLADLRTVSLSVRQDIFAFPLISGPEMSSAAEQMINESGILHLRARSIQPILIVAATSMKDMSKMHGLQRHPLVWIWAILRGRESQGNKLARLPLCMPCRDSHWLSHGSLPRNLAVCRRWKPFAHRLQTAFSAKASQSLRNPPKDDGSKIGYSYLSKS